MLIKFNKLKEYDVIPRGVIHVGMHECEEYPIYRDAGVEDMIFIEANEQLVKNVINDKPRIHIVHAAVSDKIETVTFNITNNGESSSILELGDHAKIYPGIVYTESVEMVTSTLDMIVENVGVPLKTWNVLNLDIQGAELQAMRGFTNWEYVEAVFTEVNYREMYVGCALIEEITEFLADKGFKKVEEVDTGAGWGDALYVRV